MLPRFYMETSHPKLFNKYVQVHQELKNVKLLYSEKHSLPHSLFEGVCIIMESSFSSIFTPTLKKIAVVNYPAHSPLLPRAVETVRDRGEIDPPPYFPVPVELRKRGTIDPHTHPHTLQILKSDTLQQNMLVCWAAGTNDSSTKRQMFQVFFCHNFLQTQVT